MGFVNSKSQKLAEYSADNSAVACMLFIAGCYSAAEFAGRGMKYLKWANELAQANV